MRSDRSRSRWAHSVRSPRSWPWSSPRRRCRVSCERATKTGGCCVRSVPSPRSRSPTGCSLVVGAIVVGAIAAGLVAIALSPLAPLGPVRRVYPSSGVAFDWTVLGLGVVVFVVVLSVVAFAIAYRRAPHRLTAERSRRRRSRIAQAAAASGTPGPGGDGVRFALEPGVGRRSVPVRSALLGTVDRRHDGGRDADVRERAPQPGVAPRAVRLELELRDQPEHRSPTRHARAADARLRRRGLDRAQRDRSSRSTGRPFPSLLATRTRRSRRRSCPGTVSSRPMRSCWARRRSRRLHKHVGDTVTLSYGSPADAPAYVPPSRLRVVGTATLPAVGLRELRRGPHHHGHRRARALRHRVGRVPEGPAELRPEPQRARPRLRTACGRA